MMTPAMNPVLMTVTPQQARLWLDNQSNKQRKVVKGNLSMLLKKMSEGRFKANGESISIACSGRLLDGQHRLLACEKSGTPFQAVVVFNVPDEAFDTYDIGSKRSLATILSLAGLKHDLNLTASVISHIHAYEQGLLQLKIVPTGYADPDEAIEAYANDSLIKESIEATTALGGNRTPIAVLRYLGCKVNREKTLDFLEDVRLGGTIEDYRPAVLLNRRLISTKSRGAMSAIEGQTGYKIAIGIKALNAYFEGKTHLRQLRWRADEAFPQLLGYDAVPHLFPQQE